jgi:hypothetical protein
MPTSQDEEVRFAPDSRQKEARAAADPCQPLALRAVPVAAGIVGDGQPAAVVALLDVIAQYCRAAAFDGAHNTALAAAQMAGMDLTVGNPLGKAALRSGAG